GAVVGAAAVAGAVVGSVAGAVVGAAAVAGLGAYMAWRALAGDEKHAFVLKIAIAFAATGGTSFRNADLTDANFTYAILKSTDFRTANLTRTCFRNTEKLDRARVGNSILADTRIRELLLTGNGYKKSYVGANLQGANLTGVNLNEANLKQANLNEATLYQANLESANLTETQALATDFTAASFTGACLEAWNIDANTKLDRVDCRFVYLLEYPQPGTDDRERRPSSGEFAPQEFTKLFEEVVNTIDLIFRNGIDWKAFVAAFKKVQVENEGTELTIQSIENKGDGVIVVKVSVPPDANKEHIHKNFTQSYELMAARLEDKDKQITFLEGVVNQLAAKPVTIEVKATAESNSTGNKSSNLNVGRDATGSTLNIGNIEGTVANTNNEQLESTQLNQPPQES
ncbi:pentapeptide repeat-containing protein, partial [Microcoleus sp.]|uniref:pentapeptide repeat-containing protein n=1 Tax=Microcoleus sp. TaxID=44472 RepID=UPI00352540C1